MTILQTPIQISASYYIIVVVDVVIIIYCILLVSQTVLKSWSVNYFESIRYLQSEVFDQYPLL